MTVIPGTSICTTKADVIHYRTKFGSEKCLLCGKVNEDSKDFCRISSTRGKTDVQELIKSVLGLVVVDGVLCRKSCRDKLQRIDNKRTELKAVATSNIELCNDKENHNVSTNTDPI